MDGADLFFSNKWFIYYILFIHRVHEKDLKPKLQIRYLKIGCTFANENF